LKNLDQDNIHIYLPLKKKNHVIKEKNWYGGMEIIKKNIIIIKITIKESISHYLGFRNSDDNAEISLVIRVSESEVMRPSILEIKPNCYRFLFDPEKCFFHKKIDPLCHIDPIGIIIEKGVYFCGKNCGLVLSPSQN